MAKRKTQDYEIEWVKSREKERVRAKSVADAAGIVARRHGYDGARLIPGATCRHQTVTCVPGGGMNLGAEFFVQGA